MARFRPLLLRLSEPSSGMFLSAWRIRMIVCGAAWRSLSPKSPAKTVREQRSVVLARCRTAFDCKLKISLSENLRRQSVLFRASLFRVWCEPISGRKMMAFRRRLLIIFFTIGWIEGFSCQDCRRVQMVMVRGAEHTVSCWVEIVEIWSPLVLCCCCIQTQKASQSHHLIFFSCEAILSLWLGRAFDDVTRWLQRADGNHFSVCGFRTLHLLSCYDVVEGNWCRLPLRLQLELPFGIRVAPYLGDQVGREIRRCGMVCQSTLESCEPGWLSELSLWC